MGEAAFSHYNQTVFGTSKQTGNNTTSIRFSRFIFMKNIIDKWLSPFIYSENEKIMRDARLVSLSLTGMLITCGIAIPVFLFDRAIRSNIVLVLAVGLVSSSILYILLRCGHITPAKWGTLVLLYLFVTIAAIVNGTIHAPISLLYLFFIITAGELFKWRGLLVSVFLCSLTALGFILGENLGILTSPNHVLTITSWFTYTMIFASIGLITYWGIYTLEQALNRTEDEVAERKRTETALRTSESRFRGLFEQEGDAVFIFGLDGRTRDANQRAAKMFGYTQEELRDNKGREFFASSEQSQQSFERLLAGERIPLLERTLHTKSGELLPVELSIELIRDQEGTPVHVQSVVRDITQRKQAEDALKRANEELKLRVAEVQQLQDELRELAIRDHLTGLFNRRYLNETLVREIARAEREKDPLSVIMTDIDHFKMINDTYGHPVGDKFLVEVASLMRSHARGSDIVCRYGGEEFLLVLPGTPMDIARKRAEEIRKKCSEIVIWHEEKDLKITMSFGLAIYPIHGKDAEEIIIKADKALYHSKHTGRNRVTVWGENQ
jgi:diguanylate cyclase (GGDEF)-like protein/PAS domain S-box-containing protein